MCAIINNSGWAWDDDRGACIGVAQEGSWVEWVKKNPKAAPFRNAGWCHLEAFKTLMPEAAPRGNHVFRTGFSAQTVLPPQLDDDDMNWDYEKEGADAGGDKSTLSGDESDKENDKEDEVRIRSMPLHHFIYALPAAHLENAGTVA